MKNFILLILLTSTIPIYSQDTLSYYVTEVGKKTEKENAAGIRKVIKNSEGLFKVYDYYLDGQAQMTGSYLTDSLKKKTGKFEHYYESGELKSISSFVKGKATGNSKIFYRSGQLKSSIDFVQGKKHGQLITYWENNVKKREDKFINGNFVLGKCYNINEEEIEFYPYETMPEFPGGQSALFKFLGKNINYPTKAKAKNIQGKVYINFIVTKEGEISNAYVIKGVYPSLDAEALRVINHMPDWSPGKQDGEVVSVKYNIPINFKLRNR